VHQVGRGIHTPQCVDPSSTSDEDLSLLSHKLCRQVGYSTFTGFHLDKIDLYSVELTGELEETLECRQNTSSYSIECNRHLTTKPCSHLVQVKCGDCYFFQTIRRNDSLIIRSPLYPVLQPNMVCKYDFYLTDKQGLGKVEVSEVDLSRSVSTELESQCLQSFLQILSGPTGRDLALKDVLCGRHNNITVHTLGQYIRLVLVTVGSTKGLSGFKLTVQSTPSSGLIVSKIMVFLMSFFCVFCGLGGILLCFGQYFKGKVQRKRRRRMAHFMWQGEQPVPGQSLHMNRTMRLRRLLESRENNYVMDNRVPGSRNESGNQSRPLPSPPSPNSLSSLESEEDHYNRISQQNNQHENTYVSTTAVSLEETVDLSADTIFRGSSTPAYSQEVDSQVDSQGEVDREGRADHTYLSIYGSDSKSTEVENSSANSRVALHRRRPSRNSPVAEQTPNISRINSLGRANSTQADDLRGVERSWNMVTNMPRRILTLSNRIFSRTSHGNGTIGEEHGGHENESTEDDVFTAEDEDMLCPPSFPRANLQHRRLSSIRTEKTQRATLKTE